MRNLMLLLIAILSYYTHVFSQEKVRANNVQPPKNSNRSKPALDMNALLQWNEPNDPALSVTNDGKYFTYGYNAIDFTQGREVLIVQSVDKSWKRTFDHASPVCFSENSRTLVVQHLDTLFFQALGDVNLPKYITNVASCKTPEEKGKWIAYQLQDDNKTLVLKNLLADKEYQYRGVTACFFSDKGNCLVLQMNEGKRLQYISLQTMSVSDIYQTDKDVVQSVAIDSKGEQVAFVVQQQKNGESENSIWYYKQAMEKASFMADRNTEGVDSGLFIQPSLEFSNGDHYIILKLQYKQKQLKPQEDYVKINLWNHKDSLLQSRQLKKGSRPETFAAALAINDKGPFRIQRIEFDHQLIGYRQSKGDYVVVVDRTNEEKKGDRFWMPFQRNYYLVSLKDGSRTLLRQHGVSTFCFSPSNRYLIAYDDSLENYYSYDLENLEMKCISTGIPKGWLTGRNEIYPMERWKWAEGVASWLPENAGVLVYDHYDIWLLDLKGNREPINLTEGYGRSNHIKFQLLGYDYADVINGASATVMAYSMRTKYNGFYQISVTKKENPLLLSMGPYTFFHWSRLNLGNEISNGWAPMKAASINKWIVSRQSFNEEPNYFLTSDFKKFEQLTEFNSNLNYNWLTAELVEFKQEDGTMGQGVLYKPEDFDPNKKYPVLFTYYTDLTNRLYEFPKPYYTNDAHINIAWFVSKGYLVFTPDTYISKYYPGPAVYNSVVGAAKWMAQQTFVNANCMGIAGHSYAGGLTNYLVTHTNMFAAAFEGAGVSDLVSSTLQIAVDDGASRLKPAFYPLLWQQPDLIVKNSPIMNADKVTTPLLIFHCKLDGAVPFEQAIEMFLALQSMDKKVWLLEYDDGNHSVMPKDAKDLTIRVTQYYDHYLKSAPPPKWLTQGIPARLKGIETGYELDPNGSCGKDCKICKEKKYNNQ